MCASIEVLGVNITPLTIRGLNDNISDAVKRRTRLLVVSQNLHSLYIFHHNAEFRTLHRRANIWHIDGMPLVWIGRLFGHELKREHRVTWVDWFWPLMETAAKEHWKVFYLGTSPEAVRQGVQAVRERLPGVWIQYHHGYFNAESNHVESAAVLQTINNASPDILIVGMGMPRQESWILQNYDLLATPVILTSGAAMDYVAGVIGTPPRWMGQIGLEWLFRLLEDPRRLWRRYLVEPLFVVKILVAQLFLAKSSRK